MTRHAWTTREDSTLKQVYPTRGGKAVAEMLGLRPKQVYDRAQELGVRLAVKLSRGVPFAKGTDKRRGEGRRFTKKAVAPV